MAAAPSAPRAPSRPGHAWAHRALDGVERRLKAWPLTWRLVAVLVVLLIAALGLTSLTTQIVLRNYLYNRTDDDLAAASQSAADNYADDILRNNHVTTAGIPSAYSVIYMDPSGAAFHVEQSSEEATIPAIPALPLTDARVTSHQRFVVGSIATDGRRTETPRWLVIAGPLRGGTGTYAVAISLRGVDETIRQFQVVSLGIGLLVSGSCAALGYVGLKRGLRPLRQMEDTAAAIANGDLTRRVPEHAARDELASLSHSLNAMLAHIESSFAVREASEERMRRFVTDASHELRTPLATIRGYAELYRQGAAATPEATAGAMRRIEDEATRMSGLVEDLLTLARLDNRRPLSVDDVDLTVLAADAVQDARVRDAHRPVRLVGLGQAHLGPAIVRGDEARLRQVVTNLVANALQHTPAGTPVEVAVGSAPEATEVGRGVRLEVRDHGPGLPEPDTDRAFQRFYRGDPSRGRASGGSGLGLAIVMAIVTAHGGRVGVRQTRGGGATFVVELPAAAATAHDSGARTAVPTPAARSNARSDITHTPTPAASNPSEGE